MKKYKNNPKFELKIGGSSSEIRGIGNKILLFLRLVSGKLRLPLEVKI